MNLLELARAIEDENDVNAIWETLVNGLLPHRIEHLIYITVDAQFGAPMLMTTLPELFENAPPADDPFLHWCCDSYEPTLTGAAFLSEHDYLPEAAKVFILRAKEFGFLSGVAFPVRLTGSDRFGGFNLGTGLDRASFQTEILPKIEELRLLSLLAHRRIEEVSGGFIPQPDKFRPLLVAPVVNAGGLDDLTPREREVLFLIARGLSRKECARMCLISVHTVSEYAKSAYRKLGLRNRAEAAALVAFRSDLKS